MKEIRRALIPAAAVLLVAACAARPAGAQPRSTPAPVGPSPVGASPARPGARPSPRPSPAASTATSKLSAWERRVVAETNLVRKNPAAYANKLVAMRRLYSARVLRLPGQTPLMTNEGRRALDEAIAALRRARRAPPLSVSAGMSRACADHVRDIGPKGRVSHTGSDGSDPFQRMARYGQWLDVAAENIHYGAPTAEQVVIQLLIDDAVPSRLHRKNILDPRHRVTGVACGKHRRFRTVCVATYAGGFSEKK